MAAFPRSLFSDMELEVSRWMATQLGVHDMPTVREVRNHREQVRQVAGVPSTSVTSGHGNVYTHNSVEDIIRHVSVDLQHVDF